jgi:hypothetical protein
MISLLILLLQFHLHLHLPKTLQGWGSEALIHRLWKRAAHFDFGNRFRPWVLVWGESQSHYFTDFYRRGCPLLLIRAAAAPRSKTSEHDA